MPSLCRLKPPCRAGDKRPVPAWSDSKLVGFVHAVWDGGHHAFVLDAAVGTSYQRQGLGRALVAQLIADATSAGCEWLHVDYEPHLRRFYELLRVRPDGSRVPLPREELK